MDVGAPRLEQLDEVQLLEAMVGREGEFEWRQDEEGRVSGRLQVFLNLEHELTVCVARRERKSDHGSHRLTGKTAAADHQPSPAPSSHPPCLPPPPPPPPPAASCLKHHLQTICVSHLPPLSLHFDLPLSYPQLNQPNLTLSCKWLNFTQLSLLCHHLDVIWQDDPGSVVLYNWQQFLATETLTALGVITDLCLQFEDPIKMSEKNWDQRAVQDMEHPSLLLPFLLDYSRSEREREFAESYFDCEICFLSLPGTKCKRLEPCGHIHCKDCLTLHITTKIKSGDVTKITCPSSSCEEVLLLSVIQDLVTAEVFERFDKLLLQRTLDGMSDVVYCPRPSCQCVTLREEDSNMAQCPRCRFYFCILCKHVWHGLSPCRLLPDDLKSLRETWESLDVPERREMESKYGKNKLQTAFQEYDSENWIQSNARHCPSCRSKIEKALGCNKMTCTQCNSSFCWICDAPLPRVDPYMHFRPGQSSCAGKLFEGILNDEWQDDMW